MNLYRIYDSKAEAWMQPIAMPTHGVAERECKRLANDQETDQGRHPEDYSLWYCGAYEPTSPKLRNDDPEPHCVIQFIQLVEHKQ